MRITHCLFNFVARSALLLAMTSVNGALADGSIPPRLEQHSDFANFYETTLSADAHEMFYPLPDVNQPDFNPNTFKTFDFGHFQSRSQLLQFVRNDPQYVSAMPWIYSAYPSIEVRRLGYEKMFKLSPVSRATFNDESIEQLKNRALRLKFLNTKGAKFTTRITKEFPASLSTADILARDENVGNNVILKWLACARLSPFHARKCTQALDSILKFMSPSGGLSAIPLLKKVIDSPEYVEGVSFAALKITEKVDLMEQGKLTNPGDLFSDLKEGFLKSGMNDKRAEELTWDVLGFYSTRGANIDVLFPYSSGKPGSKTLIALETLAMGSSVLDSSIHRTGKLYSLPKSISTVAEYGKTYHFWMAAYLSRKIRNEFGSATAATVSTAISELGYQMFSTTQGREKLFETLLTTGQFSDAANKTRIDLLFGFAGAEYGARFSDPELGKFRIDVDYAVKKMIENTHLQSSWSSAELDNILSGKYTKLRAYWKWLQVINPLGALSAVRSQNNCTQWLRPELKTPYALSY